MNQASEVKRLLQDTQAAEVLGIAVQTMRNWRYLGIGVPYVRLGSRTIRYDAADLERYIFEGRVVPRTGTPE